VTNLSLITINIDPDLHLGPVTLAWHGLTIAIGILVGGLAAARFARERGLDLDPLYTIGGLLALGGWALRFNAMGSQMGERMGETTAYPRQRNSTGTPRRGCARSSPPMGSRRAAPTAQVIPPITAGSVGLHDEQPVHVWADPRASGDGTADARSE
jgi:hypothetical protein